MIEIEIPGWARPLQIRSVVLDYNGTIARDGTLLPGAAERIRALSRQAAVYVLTADTYGTVEAQCAGLGVTVKTFPRAGAAACKEEIVRALGEGVCAVGNGLNDIPMCDAAAALHRRAGAGGRMRRPAVPCGCARRRTGGCAGPSAQEGPPAGHTAQLTGRAVPGGEESEAEGRSLLQSRPFFVIMKQIP